MKAVARSVRCPDRQETKAWRPEVLCVYRSAAMQLNCFALGLPNCAQQPSCCGNDRHRCCAAWHSSGAAAAARQQSPLPAWRRCNSRWPLAAVVQRCGRPCSSSAADGSQAAKGPSFVAVAELAQNVTSKVQKAIDILEGSLDFDDLMKVNEALSQLQDVKMHLMEWLPKEARARGLPHVVNTHPAREPSQSRSSAPSIDDDPLA